MLRCAKAAFMYHLNWRPIFQNFDLLWQVLLIGLGLALLSLAMGCLIGILTAFARVYGGRPIKAVATAYIDGIESFCKAGGDPSRIASVASFFVSRVDTAVDKMLEESGEKGLLGKAAVANARVAYARFVEIFAGKRWDTLAAKGAMPRSESQSVSMSGRLTEPSI